MARRTVLLAVTASSVAGLIAPVPQARSKVIVNENFGFDFAEDQAANTDFVMLGERRLKTEFIKSYKPTATVLEGKPYPVFQEVQEKKILSATAESGLLGALDGLGLTLSDVEKLLPAIDELGILGVAAKNLPLAIVATGYLLIEPAPFLLPVLGPLLSVPSGAYAAIAAATTAAEVWWVVLGHEAPLDIFGPLLVAPLLLLSGVLSLLPLAIGAIKGLPEPKTY
mmetsp:Transcript_7399/g.21893  ORF Transcript_7399/g.21893 Transcript_7399/m.21893 type:complete len:225 (+) Transcript_7399:108-782(+)